MLPFMVFLIIALIGLAVVGAVFKGMFFILTIAAAVALAVTIAVGAWTMARRRDRA